MIPKQEVMALAAELQLQAHVVEKDYALGWLLAGIAAHPVIGPRWVFKGGTCLKKCCFETYRFSEDLDFTLQDAEHLDESFLSWVFEEIGDWVYDACGLQLPPETRRFEVFTNPRGSPSAQGRVGYHGPLGRAGDPPRIKLDLATDEVLVLTPVQRPVHHPYTDIPDDGIHVLSYSFEEVFAEKMCALAERQTLERNLILRAVDVAKSEPRTYRLDRIKSATVIRRTFTPRYAVELTASGPLNTPAAKRLPAASSAFSSVRSPAVRKPARPATGPRSGFGLSYTFACTACGKTFKRDKDDATLNPHKNKQGWPCPGRVGSLKNPSP